MREEFDIELTLLLKSKAPLIFLLTQEEDRARRFIDAASKQAGRNVAYPRLPGDTPSVKTLLDGVEEAGAVVVLDDVHRRLEDPAVLRLLGDIPSDARWQGRTVVVIASWVDIPPELERISSVLTLPLPRPEDLRRVMDEACVDSGVMLTEEDAERVIRSAQGMTEQEAFRTFKKAFVGWPEDADGAIASVVRDKKITLRRSRVLEDVDVPISLADVGGLDRLKDWLASRKDAFSDEAKSYGLPAPRGLLLMGIQGCGKSLSAKAVADHWRLPLARLDISSVFGSERPEAALRDALRVAEAMAPVVLWIDEIEKGFDKGGEGPAARLLGGMVTWLQEKTREVFVVATANRVQDLPPELPRKGRFDEIFFVDLPDLHERKDILTIHLKKRGRDPEKFNVEALARKADRLTGSELEQLLIAALHLSFSRGEELTDRDLMRAAKEMVPLYDTFEEEIKKLREWARKRARPASTDRRKVDLFAP